MALCWFKWVIKFWKHWNVAISEKCFTRFVSHKKKISKLLKTVLFNVCIICFCEDQQILCFYFQQNVKSLWLKQMKEQLFWSLETDFITWKVSKSVSWLQRIMKYKKCLCKKKKITCYWWLIPKERKKERNKERKRVKLNFFESTVTVTIIGTNRA